jgi:hypothetical protein
MIRMSQCWSIETTRANGRRLRISDLGVLTGKLMIAAMDLRHIAAATCVSVT